jgi:hypothetical protein
MEIGRARRAASLYSRWHKTQAYVLKHDDGSYSWTAPFKITDEAVVLPPKSKIVVTFVDGLSTTTALFAALATVIHHSMP